VTVQDWNPNSCDCFPMGRTGFTSAICRY
jgi:hypothetical protein